MKDSELQKLYETVMDGMVHCGWLLGYSRTHGKGFHLNWTEAGTAASVQLKKWAESMRLLDGDAPAVFCYELAKGDGW
jgi:hypothetical protein